MVDNKRNSPHTKLGPLPDPLIYITFRNSTRQVAKLVNDLIIHPVDIVIPRLRTLTTVRTTPSHFLRLIT